MSLLKVDSIMELIVLVLRVDSYYFTRFALYEVEETWIKIFGCCVILDFAGFWLN